MGKVKDLDDRRGRLCGVPSDEIPFALCCGKVKEDGALGGEVADVEAGRLRETKDGAFFEGGFIDAEGAFAMDSPFKDASLVYIKGAISFKGEGGISAKSGVLSEVPGVCCFALAPIPLHTLGDILLKAKASTFNKDGAKRYEGVTCKDNGPF